MAARNFAKRLGREALPDSPYGPLGVQKERVVVQHRQLQQVIEEVRASEFAQQRHDEPEGLRGKVMLQSAPLPEGRAQNWHAGVRILPQTLQHIVADVVGSLALEIVENPVGAQAAGHFRRL